MSGIPLVALSVKPQQFQDPVENDTRAMQLKALGQQTQQQAALAPGQQQLQQQAIQSGQQTIQQQQTTNQQQQLALQDQMTMRSLASKYIKKDDEGNATGFDFNGFAQDAASKGVNPATVQQIQLQHAQTVKGLADADETTRNNEIAKNKQSYEVLEGLKGLPDQQQKAAAYPSAVQQLQKLGIDTSRFPQTYPGDQGVTDFETGLGMHQQILDDSKKVSDINKSNADEFKEVPGTGMFFNPVTNETKTAAGGPTLSPQMMESKYVQVQQAQKLGQPVTPEDKAFAASYEKMKTLVPAMNFNLNQGSFATPPQISPGATGQQAMSQMNPQMASLVKTVGEYRQKSQDVTQRMPPNAKANFLTALNAAYPNYDENEFPARNKMITSFTSGPESKSINAINTAMGHVGVLNDAIDALNGGDMKVLNSIANKFGLQTGATPVTTFNTIVHRVGPELAAAYIQGGGGEGERGTTAADFDPSLSPTQLKSNTAITAKLLRSKIGSLENQWNETMKPGTPEQQFQSRFITPEAQATLNKLAPTGGAQGGGQTQSGAPSNAISVTDPRGKIHYFPDQQSADNFKKDAGIK